MLSVLIGDIFQSDAQTLVNTVNCVGVMGKGIAEEFKKRFPEMYQDYKNKCEEGKVKTGSLTFYNYLLGKKVINFPTKRHWKSPALLKDVESGLNYFLENYKEWGITSVAFPPLGCGNGGLSWEDVGPLMYEKLKDISIPVEIFAPFGTPAAQLTLKYLEENKTVISSQKGVWTKGTLTPGEISVLEVLFRLQKEKYAKPIGRTMFQKACYILASTGVDTSFSFERHSYGPFSREAERALSVYANKNLIKEEQLGKMFRLTVTESYLALRSQYAESLEENKNGINRAIDLLSRIKDTAQGEEVATIMYAASVLNNEYKDGVLESDIVNYIFKWKKKWETDIQKKESLVRTIYNLNILKWVHVSLPVDN